MTAPFATLNYTAAMMQMQRTSCPASFSRAAKAHRHKPGALHSVDSTGSPRFLTAERSGHSRRHRTHNKISRACVPMVKVTLISLLKISYTRGSEDCTVSSSTAASHRYMEIMLSSSFATKTESARLRCQSVPGTQRVKCVLVVLKQTGPSTDVDTGAYRAEGRELKLTEGGG